MRAFVEPEPYPSYRGLAPADETNLVARPLAAGGEHEALEFLAARPLHTVYMAGFIRDNGLESPLNRGVFYGCRDAAGRLAGLGLIGHVTQVEARAPWALRALARAAQECDSAHVILGEQDRVRDFWHHYAGAGQALRLVCRELLVEQRCPVEAAEAVPELRPAAPEDLPLIVPVQAAMAFEECGVNPLDVDPDGFVARCARRIARGRSWVAVSEGRLDFKVDVMAETPEAAYIEGVHVGEHMRGRGYGRRCLLQFGRVLLARTRAVCLLVNERNTAAQSFYVRAGYRTRALYETIYLHRAGANTD